MTRRLVVVGASHAGVAAATAARDAGWPGDIVLLSAESRPPYQRPPLSKEVLAAGAAPAPLGVLDGIELRLGEQAQALDPDGGTILTAAGRIGYDAVVLATGAAPRTLPGSARTHTLRTYEDALRLGEALAEARRLVVVGAGFIGAEVGSAARARGLEVTLLEQAPLPLAGLFGEETARHLGALHAAHGSVLRTGVAVGRVMERDGRTTGVELADGELIPADLVVTALGVSAASGWLEGSGLELTADGSVCCDTQLRTSLPGVWAAGDLTRVGEVGCGHVLTAAEQGRVAGLNAAGAAESWSPSPFVWSQWYGHRIQLAGVRGAETVVTGDAGDGLLALSRDQDRLVGVLGLDRPRQVAALRRTVGRDGSWTAALASLSATAS